MAFVRLNDAELEALSGLPLFVRSLYVFGVKPHMDLATGLVGIRRKISWQGLQESLYVEPHQGEADTGTPHKSKIRRAASRLESAGLIAGQSREKQLIFLCLLADTDNSEKKKADTKPTQSRHTQPDTSKGSDSVQQQQKPDTKPTYQRDNKPDTHPSSVIRTRKNTCRADAARRVIAELNLRTGRSYQAVAANLEKIEARMKEGATEAECIQVVERKTMQWLADEKMNQYLRPATLFNREKFAQYVGELGAPIPPQQGRQQEAPRRARKVLA